MRGRLWLVLLLGFLMVAVSTSVANASRKVSLTDTLEVAATVEKYTSVFYKEPTDLQYQWCGRLLQGNENSDLQPRGQYTGKSGFLSQPSGVHQRSSLCAGRDLLGQFTSQQVQAW